MSVEDLIATCKEKVRELMPQLAETELIVTPQHGGYSADSFSVRIPGQEAALFMRCQKSGPEDSDPVLQRRGSHDQQHMRQMMSSFGLGPRALATGAGFNIDAFEEGGAVDFLELKDNALWEKLGGLLGKIHDAPLEGFSAQTPWVDDYLLAILNAKDANDFSVPRESIENAKSRWPIEGLAMTLVPSHGDFHVGNVLQRGEELLITDFENSGLNYAGYDVAFFFYQYFLESDVYPRLDQREAFARGYLAARGRDENVHRFLLQVECFAPKALLTEGFAG
mmetsp:Transcript_30518/g.59882  ORF Transcript_30518/g.59882 Transcript_30518/m.59882 type:complete len:280 (-) Transcript_30518:381-1220(-)